MSRRKEKTFGEPCVTGDLVCRNVRTRCGGLTIQLSIVGCTMATLMSRLTLPPERGRYSAIRFWVLGHLLPICKFSDRQAPLPHDFRKFAFPKSPVVLYLGRNDLSDLKHYLNTASQPGVATTLACGNATCFFNTPICGSRFGPWRLGWGV